MMKTYLLVTLATACTSQNTKLCDTMVEARHRGDYDRVPEEPAALDRHSRVCQASCYEPSRPFNSPECLEFHLTRAELHGPGADLSATWIHDWCAKGNRIACDWATHHAELYDRELREKAERDRKLEDEQAMEHERQRIADQQRERDRATSREESPAVETGDPLDRVLARSDRELKAEGYEIVQTVDRSGSASFGYSVRLTDRMIQVVCVSRAPFHGSMQAGSSTSEFDHVDAGVPDTYVEHFAIPLEVNHPELRFSIGGGSGRLACRVYKK